MGKAPLSLEKPIDFRFQPEYRRRVLDGWLSSPEPACLRTR